MADSALACALLVKRALFLVDQSGPEVDHGLILRDLEIAAELAEEGTDPWVLSKLGETKSLCETRLGRKEDVDSPGETEALSLAQSPPGVGESPAGAAGGRRRDSQVVKKPKEPTLSAANPGFPDFSESADIRLIPCELRL